MCRFPLHPGAKQQHNALTLLLHLSVADRKQWAVYILWWTGLPRIPKRVRTVSRPEAGHLNGQGASPHWAATRATLHKNSD